MRVCVYLESVNLLTPSGFPSAFRNQLQALQTAGVKVTTDPRDRYDLLHVDWTAPKSLYYLRRAKRRGIRVVAHAHSVGAFDMWNSFTLSNRVAPLYDRYVHWFYAQADCVFTPSERARELLLAKGLRRVAVVSNGIDRDRFRFSQAKRDEFRANLGLDRFTVYAAGNVFPRKGVSDFIDVAHVLPTVDFIWYGYRWKRILTYYPEMHRRIARRPPNVRFAGFVRDTIGAFSACDALFFPSQGETQSLVVLEAASLGRPLILRDLPEYHGWLTEGKNCLMGRTVEEFAELVKRVSEEEPLRAALSREAEALAEAHRLERIGERLRTLYEAVLEGRDVTWAEKGVQRAGGAPHGQMKR
ncbi:MAG: glycosyltransferase family 4 protein [Candidatus Bipolaricaulota bacterium]|nr:glycosyltransferase family 4 protein [Candidatus Bipolaricaulota bacterium]